MKNIIITGFMGTGKTVVGNVLAKKLSCSFVDLDTLIEEMEGKSIPEIFAEKGEYYFRQVETNAIKGALQGETKVISTGGGALLKKENQQMLIKGGAVICLTASVEEIYKRVGTGEGRPLLKAEDPLKVIRELLKKREDIYGKVPHKISTNGKSPEKIAEEIIYLLKKNEYIQTNF